MVRGVSEDSFGGGVCPRPSSEFKPFFWGQFGDGFKQHLSFLALRKPSPGSGKKHPNGPGLV
eukprot:14150173-Heterocapsa_arctica.AAC.1